MQWAVIHMANNAERGLRVTDTVCNLKSMTDRNVAIQRRQGRDEALCVTARHHVRRLPVVEEDGGLAGIVARADIARSASDVETGDISK